MGDFRMDNHAEKELKKHRSLRAGSGGDTRASLYGFHNDLDEQQLR